MKFIESDLLVFAKDLLLVLKLPRIKCVEILLTKGFLWSTAEINRTRYELWNKMSKHRILESPMVVKKAYDKSKKRIKMKINKDTFKMQNKTTFHI